MVVVTVVVVVLAPPFCRALSAASIDPVTTGVAFHCICWPLVVVVVIVVARPCPPPLSSSSSRCCPLPPPPPVGVCRRCLFDPARLLLRPRPPLSLTLSSLLPSTLTIHLPLLLLLLLLPLLLLHLVVRLRKPLRARLLPSVHGLDSCVSPPTAPALPVNQRSTAWYAGRTIRTTSDPHAPCSCMTQGTVW